MKKKMDTVIKLLNSIDDRLSHILKREDLMVQLSTATLRHYNNSIELFKTVEYKDKPQIFPDIFPGMGNEEEE